MGENGNACEILMGKPKGKRPPGRARCRLEDDIKMNLKEIGWDHVDWICMAESTNKCVAVVNTLMDYGLNKIKGIL
jgi:hypothetical protein